MPYCEVGQVVDIKGLGSRVRVAGHYDYANARTNCPNCNTGADGVPWHGWFMCDTDCGAVCLVETGEVFMPIDKPTAEKKE